MSVVREAMDRATLDDGINAYRLFLGRYPRTVEELPPATGGTIEELIAGLVTQGEFTDNVIDRIAKGRPTPHTLLAAELDIGLQRWALERLPMTEPARAALATSRSWRFWITRLIGDAAFVGALPAVAREWLADSGPVATVAATAFSPVRQLAGEIRYEGAGRLEGWCANLRDPDEVVIVEFFLGDRFIGAKRCNEAMPGLEKRIGGTDLHGFSLVVPASNQDLMARGATLRVLDAQSKQPVVPDIYLKDNLPVALDGLTRLSGQVAQLREALERVERQLPPVLARVAPPVDAYEQFKALQSGPPAYRNDGAAPSVAVVLTSPDSVDPVELGRMLAGLELQASGDWTLVVVEEDPATRPHERTAMLAPLTDAGRVVTTTAAALADTLRGDDRLAGADVTALIGGVVGFEPGALGRLAAAAARGGGVAYGDHEVRLLLPDGREGTLVPVFKPGFDPLMALAYDFVGPVVVAATQPLLRALDLDRGAPPHGQWLVLALLDVVGAGGFTHLPEVLYTLRQPVGFTAASQVPRLLTGDPAAVSRWAVRNGLDLTVGTTLVRSAFGDHGPLLFEPCTVEARVATPPPASVIVPTRNAPALLRGCLESLLRVRARYGAPVQIIVIDHENEDPDSLALMAMMRQRHGVVIMPFRGPFNWSVMNDLAADAASGEMLAFLNDDTVALAPDWLSRAAGTLGLPKVGAVGARLLYADGRLQHAGVVVSREQGPVHEGIGLPAGDGGYLGRNRVLRAAAAVTGACLVTGRSIFRAVGGFDRTMPVNWNDIDYCMAVRRAGYLVAYDPEVCLYHFESKTRGHLAGDDVVRAMTNVVAQMDGKWRDMLEADSFHNRAFSRYGHPFTRLDPGRRPS